MTSKEQAELAEKIRAFKRMAPVDGMDPFTEYWLNMTALKRLVVLLLKQIAEMETTSEELTDG